jgi:hypothetical protein
VSDIVRVHHRRRGALAAVVFATVGCYAYMPARDATSLVGRRASIALTDSGSVVLGARIGQGVVNLEGIYLGDSAGAHLLAVAVSRTRNGAESDWKGEHVGVPRALVASLDEREFSASRSAFAGALGTVGVVAMTFALRGRGEGGQGGPVPTGRPGQ